MKRLRRKKSSENISNSKKSQAESKYAGAAGSGVHDPTPLYSRFTSSRREESSTVRPIVSGPIMLTPKSSGNVSYTMAPEQSPATPRKQLRRIPSSSMSPSYDHTTSSHISNPYKARTHIATSPRSNYDPGAVRSPLSKVSPLPDSDAGTRAPTRPREDDVYSSSPIISAMMLQAIITTPEPQQHVPLPHAPSQPARPEALPTPPPSTVSFAQAPTRTTQQQQFPHADRRDKLPPESTSHPNSTSSGMPSSTQNAPIRRRKYSLLAAFGPAPSSSSLSESNISKSDSAERISTQVRERDSYRETSWSMWLVCWWLPPGDIEGRSASLQPPLL